MCCLCVCECTSVHGAVFHVDLQTVVCGHHRGSGLLPAPGEVAWTPPLL